MATSVFAGDSRSGQSMAEINITPLVDVMLVLLIIFMVAAPLVTGTLDLRLPQAPQRDLPVTKPQHISLSVQADGSYVLDGVVLGERALQSALTNVARGAPNTIVSIAANENADYQAFTGALAAARNSGITNISLEQ
ncbi:MAG TPA: biopolymer transporter ExbD [Lysobacter sp.]|jgi:biopolymer transport protein ExbD|nr:biopolymer transporter ExbD [Lysobacter sp.]